MSKEISPVEAEQLRALLQKYDNEHKPIAIHNLNDPPKVPYRYQKFPKMLYNHQQSQPAHEVTKSAVVGNSIVEELVQVRAKVVTMIVHNENDLRDALSDGWKENPPEYRDEPGNDLKPQYAEEAARVDETVRRKPGRPPREVVS